MLNCISHKICLTSTWRNHNFTTELLQSQSHCSLMQ